MHQKKIAVLLEHEKLTQERFFFLKESELRKREFTIEQRKKQLKKISDTKNGGKEQKQAIQELKALRKKLVLLINEACHKVAKKVAVIARRYLRKTMRYTWR